MRNIIDMPDMTPLLKNKTFFKLEVDICAEFNDAISISYPWHGDAKDRIDWDKISNHLTFDWYNATHEETLTFFKQTRLGKYDALGIVFGASQPGIVGNYNTICANLELCSSYCLWTIYIVGASKNKYGLYRLHNEDFIELWSKNLLMRTKNKE